ncbi:MAG: glycosyltransferase family 2 protein [Chitinophagaceae bacterium]
MNSENADGALVSIITPCYNQAEYLAETLESIKKQTYQNWECIIISDGSPDNVKEIAEKFIEIDKRFIFFDTENGGPSVARNFGIKKSSGEFILPLDGDDLISSNYLEECVKAMINFPDATIVYGTAEKFGLINEKWPLPKYDFQKLLFANIIHCSGLYRKKDWKNIGGYDERMRDGIEDWEFWINLLKNNSKVLLLENITFYWRIKNTSRTKKIDAFKNDKLQQYIYLKHHQLYEEYFVNPISLYKEKQFLESKIKAIQNKPIKYGLWWLLKAKHKSGK